MEEESYMDIEEEMYDMEEDKDMGMDIRKRMWRWWGSRRKYMEEKDMWEKECEMKIARNLSFAAGHISPYGRIMPPDAK